MGLNHRQVVVVMYIMTAMAAGMGMFMMLTRDAGAAAIFFSVFLLLILVFRIAGAVRLRDTLAGLREKNTISRCAKQEVETFENAELHFQRAKTFDQWWQAVCLATERMGFIKSSLPLSNRDGTRRVLVWEKDGHNSQTDNIVKMTLPIRDRRNGAQLNLEVKVCTNGSLESAGRRMTLFGRLLEEHSIASLNNPN